MNSLKFIGTHVGNFFGRPKEPEVHLRRRKDAGVAAPDGAQLEELHSSNTVSDSPAHDEPPNSTLLQQAWQLFIWPFLLSGRKRAPRAAHAHHDPRRSKRRHSTNTHTHAHVQRPDGHDRARQKSRRSSSLSVFRPLALRNTNRKTLVLDLDETLIHSMTRGSSISPAHVVEVIVGQLTCIYYVDKRPFCDLFLQKVSEWYNVVIFTASVRNYADPMVDWLEKGSKIFSKRFSRSDCIATEQGYIKDLSVLGEDLSQVVLVDNSPISLALHPFNGISVEGWISDPSDKTLLHLLPLLRALSFTTDVRSILGLRYGPLLPAQPTMMPN